MPTTMEIYRGHQLMAVEQPSGTWRVEIERVGGDRKQFQTESHAKQADAFATARLMIDRGVTA